MSSAPIEARIDQPGFSNFALLPAEGEDAVSGFWEMFDRGKTIAIPLPEYNNAMRSGYARRTLAPNAIEIICPSDPEYALVRLFASVTFKAPGTAPRVQKQEWVIRFNQPWGGVAKATFPYPADWQKRWDADEWGRRALVLIYDLINQLPDGLRETAGSMPIIRYEQLPFNFAGGFNAPYVSDCIILTDGYIKKVSPGSPTLTKGDLYFVSVVLHEIGHAVTYRKASLGVHQALSPLLHALRSIPLGQGQIVSYKLPAVIAAAHGLLFHDFVSEYARVSNWELAGWIVRFVRFVSVVGPVIDLIDWLCHPNETKGYPTLRPNVITGYWGIGNLPIFWLVNTGIDFKAIEALKREEARLWSEFIKAATPAEQAAAKTAWRDARDKLASALASSGAVSQYGTVDVLEDIAETITAITFSPEQLATIRDDLGGFGQADAYVTRHPDGTASEGFEARRKFLVKEGLFPKYWKKLVPGAFLQGKEPDQHLDDWTVTL